MLKKWMFGFLVLIMIPTFASATLYSFTSITGNSDLSGQLSVDVTGTGTTAYFKFFNDVGIASSIADVYFDDGGLLGTFAISDSGAGVDFGQLASPGDLPGGNTISPAFVTSTGLSADSEPPVAPNGVSASTEWLLLTFNIINENDIDDVFAALGDGSLRIGLHVQAIASFDDGSDSYVNGGTNGGTPVPEPGTMILLGSGLVGLAGWGRKKFSK